MKTETWCLCKNCIDAIRSRGEQIFVGDEVMMDEEDPKTFTCEWCEEDGVIIYECL